MPGNIRLFPFLDWFPLKSFRSDLLAGITVALLLIPQSMAYANLAGLPYLQGLNAAFLPLLFGALFGCSFHLSTGPVAMTSILVASVLSSFALPGTDQYLQYAYFLAFLIAFIRIFVAFTGLSRLANLISFPVILGFTNAAAFTIALSQLEKWFGLVPEQYHGWFGSLGEFLHLAGRLPESHLPSILMGLLALIIILLLRRYPKIPAVLVAVLCTTALSYFIGFEEIWQGKVIGEIPRGLPRLSNPLPNGSIMDFLVLSLKFFPSALAIVIIGFLEVLSVSKSVSSQSGQAMNYNQEMLGQGMASLAASFTSAYPVSGSLSRTALSFMAGSKSGLAQIISSVIVLFALLFFTPLLYHLPASVLAVSIIMAVKRLIRIKEMVRFYSLSKREFLLSFSTFLITLAAAPNLPAGIFCGMGFSLILTLLLDKQGGFTEPFSEGSVLVLRIRRSLLFTQINQMEEVILERINKQKELHYLEIRGRSLQKVDISGLEGFKRLARKFQERGGFLAFISLDEGMERYLLRLQDPHIRFFSSEEDFLYSLSLRQTNRSPSLR